MNGDGYSDFLIGSVLYSNGEFKEGRAYVHLGSASGLSLTPAWIGESNQVGAEFGMEVSTAGDVNGDGFSDIIVGAWRYDNGQTDEGRAFVYHGSASGLSVPISWTADGDQSTGQFGISVSSAGDVNGDGYSDVIIGANCYDNGQTDEGRAYVYLGSSAGLLASPSWIAESDQAFSFYGSRVSTAGDVNGDGWAYAFLLRRVTNTDEDVRPGGGIIVGSLVILVENVVGACKEYPVALQTVVGIEVDQTIAAESDTIGRILVAVAHQLPLATQFPVAEGAAEVAAHLLIGTACQPIALVGPILLVTRIEKIDGNPACPLREAPIVGQRDTA